MEDEIRQLEQVFRSLNANKDSVMSELKNLSTDIMDKLKRHNDFPADIKPILKEAKKLSREVNDSNIQDKALSEMLNAGNKKIEEQAPKADPSPEEEPLAENLSNLDLNDVSEENEGEENEDEITLTAEEEAEFLAAADADAAAEDEEEGEIKDEAEEEKKGSFFDRFN
jgi:cell division initiation protein